MSDEAASRTAAGPVELRSIADRVEIAPGVTMPRLGMGTSHLVGGDVGRVIAAGLAMGYRLIDTATSYGNESEIGEALAHSGIARDELFVTTKVWPSDQGYERTLRAFEASRSRLRLDRVDLYLIHWPEPSLTPETWRALEKLLANGEVRAIGVSNFMIGDFEQLYETANVPPAVDQIELHPHLQQPALQAYCRSRGVAIEAWAPLMSGRVGEVPELVEIGGRHGKTAAQVTLRWILQKGIVTPPKSAHEDRLRENAGIFDFSLTVADMAVIDALDRGEHER